MMACNARLRQFGFGLAAAALLMGSAASQAQELKVGLKSEPTSMDPHYHALTTNFQISAHIFDSLTALDPNLQLIPGLALSWKTVGSDIWEFTLRPDVKFSDGSPLTADDVAFSIERVAKVPNSPSPVTITIRGIQRVEVVGPLTVRLHTDGPRPLVPTSLANLSIMSRKAASGPSPEGKSTAQLNQGDGLIGTGPFKFVSWSRGGDLVLERNDTYWGPKPSWAKVLMRPLSNPAARVNALLSGGVDLVEDPPIDDMAQLKKNPKLTIQEAPSVRLIFLAFNVSDDSVPGITGTQGKNPLKDVRVRRALSEAIDRKALVAQVMGGFGAPAAELMMPGSPGTRSNGVIVKHDPQHARKLLAEAGYPGGFTLSLGTPNGRYQNDLKVAQAVASMWSRVGVKTTVEASSPAIFFKNMMAKAYSSTLGGWGDVESSARARALVSTRNDAKGWGTANWGGYANAEVDALLDAAVNTLDDGKRSALLQQVTAQAIDTDAALTLLYFERSAWGMRKGLSYAARPDQQTRAQFVTPSGTK
ncbi:ABC transporter substrate-binding protein [Variovorax sp. J22P271]|nr:ABC transporter substrate-binding protein [Variovorax sp. J22P271]MDM0033791.1 ABC transporter substrate-binding protein [Variovorax sp. J22P271]